MSKDSIRNRKKFFSRSEAKIKDLKTMRLNRFDQKTWIYEAWKEKWNEKLEKEDDSLFYKLFCYDYIYTCNACVKNKKMNFRMKIVCLLPLIFTYIFLFIMKIVQVVKALKVSGIETNLIIVSVLLTIVLAKWVNVKKYQETWNRHSAHRHELEMQMFCYISEMGEYGYSNRKEDFIIAIMSTWNVNQKKFNENMKNEEQIVDIIKNIKDML